MLNKQCSAQPEIVTMGLKKKKIAGGGLLYLCPLPTIFGCTGIPHLLTGVCYHPRTWSDVFVKTRFWCSLGSWYAVGVSLLHCNSRALVPGWRTRGGKQHCWVILSDAGIFFCSLELLVGVWGRGGLEPPKNMHGYVSGWEKRLL